jgi:hypothetical protein
MRVRLENLSGDRRWLFLVVNLGGALVTPFLTQPSLVGRVVFLAVVLVVAACTTFQVEVDSKDLASNWKARLNIVPLQLRDPAKLRGDAIFRAGTIGTVMLDLGWIIGVPPVYYVVPAVSIAVIVLLMWYAVARLKREQLERKGLSW